MSEVARLCPTLRNLMDCSPPGSSAHGIFQARVLEWGAIALSSGYTRVPKKIYTSLTFVPICSCGPLASCEVPFRCPWESLDSISPHDQAPVSCPGLLPGDTHHSFLHCLLSTPAGTKVPHWAPLLLPLDTTVSTRHQPPADTPTIIHFLQLPHCCAPNNLSRTLAVECYSLGRAWICFPSGGDRVH